LVIEFGFLSSIFTTCLFNKPLKNFYSILTSNFPFNPTVKQDLFFQKIAVFLESPSNDSIFVLKGYAGTGKTTVISTIVNNLIEIEKKIMINYSGLWIGNFYNIMRNNYFEHAKKIKWLFFPYEINDRKDKFYLIQALNKVLDLDKIIDSKCNNYDDLIIDDQINFRNNFKNLVNNLSLNNPIITNVMTIDLEIIKYLLIFMVNNYSQKNNLPLNKKFQLNIENEQKKNL
jgi:hypothetical protein